MLNVGLVVLNRSMVPRVKITEGLEWSIATSSVFALAKIWEISARNFFLIAVIRVARPSHNLQDGFLRSKKMAKSCVLEQLIN